MNRTWCHLDVNILTDPKMTYLRKKFGHKALVFWVGMLTQCDDDGVFRLPVEVFLPIIDLKRGEYDQLLAAFSVEKIELLTVSESGEVRITRWEKHNKGLSNSTSTSTPRVQKHREKLSMKRNETLRETKGETLHETSETSTEEKREEEKREEENVKRVSPSPTDRFIQEKYGSPSLSAYSCSRLSPPTKDYQPLSDLCKTVDRQNVETFIEALGACISAGKRSIAYLRAVYQGKLSERPQAPPIPDYSQEIEEIDGKISEIEGETCVKCGGTGKREFTHEDELCQDQAVKQFGQMHTGGNYPFPLYSVGDLIDCECVKEREGRIANLRRLKMRLQGVSHG